jgi:hypothetical protein
LDLRCYTPCSKPNQQYTTFLRAKCFDVVPLKNRGNSSDPSYRSDLETLIGSSKADRTNYVHDWATKHAAAAAANSTIVATGLGVVPPIGTHHAAAVSSPSSLSPTSPTEGPQSLRDFAGENGGSSLRSSLLTRSRRRLPAVPGGGANSPANHSPDQQLSFSPESESPSPHQVCKRTFYTIV